LERNYSSCTCSSSGGAQGKKKDRVKLRKPSETIIWFPEFHAPPWMLMYFFGPKWSSTHQSTNVDGWCTDGCTFFVPPCPWANQGGELKLTFFSSFAQPRLIFFWELFFSSTPTPAQVSPTSLHLDYLHMHLGLLPPPPTYLPTHLFTYSPICLPSNQPTYLCTYTLNLHQGNDDACRWRYCNIPGRLLHSPSYLPPY